MKLLRILGVFLAISLFAGCEVWISFWGDAASDREIRLEIRNPYSPGTIAARLYQKSGSVYGLVDSTDGGGSETLNTTFRGLNSGVYRVMVWNDDGDGDPLYFDGSDGEFGFTTDPIDLFFFFEYTVEASTGTEWTEIDGSAYVTPVN